ncbi:MAG: hypothetical protein ABJB12_01270 [Pseudomonadota bacterium]
MASEYEKATATLYQAAPEVFATERQRLVAELKGNGDKSGAAKLAKLARPTLSAWAVNQLWWHARSDFEQLFETAKELRAGKLAARAAHREGVAKLTRRAQRLLSEAGHPGNEATLRRVTMTLSGLAAAGGFEPDLPGALTKDRAPAGFEAFGVGMGEQAEQTPAPKPHGPAHAAPPRAPAKADTAAQRAREHQAAEQARREAAARKKKEAEAHARLIAEGREARAALHSAKATLTKSEAEHAHAAKALAAAEQDLKHARSVVQRAEERVAALKGEQSGNDA